MDHDDFDFDDEIGVACVPFHDVPYVSPGMIPPGPVWLDLTTYDEAVSGGKKKSKTGTGGRLSQSFKKAAGDSSASDTFDTSIATATVPPVGWWGS